MIVIYGSSGFIGSHIVKELIKNGIPFLCSKTRIHDYVSIKKELLLYNPTNVINAAGFATPNNIDFYEENVENKSNLTLVNTAGNIILANLCESLNIHFITIMSGCIYDSTCTEYSTKYRTFIDKDKPNFFGSLYSKNRILTEELLSVYNNICIIRIRMPISSYMHPKSLINKLLSYRKITNLPNSITVLDDCIPRLINIIKKKRTGTINLVNSGSITNSYICYLYKKFVNRRYKFSVVSLEEIENDNSDKAKRSNCIIIPSFRMVEMPDVVDSIICIFKKFKLTKDIYC
jgi:nucleoside-diphosphate-sugar epimerase